MSARVVVIGAGFGGLAVAIGLRRDGVPADDVVVLERADDVGGVWRDNTYPGAACDVPSPLYSYSFAPNPSWPRFYAEQPDILAYLRDVAEREDVRRLVRTGVTVTDVTWQPAGHWEVRTESGETFAADVVVSAVGQLSQPSVPPVPGADDFDGPAFHSARWRHDLDLRGQRVAVVGTGASAIQFVPHLAEQVLPDGAVTVFQRSAPYVVPKPDHPSHPLLETLLEKVPPVQLGGRGAVYGMTELVNTALNSRTTMQAVERLWARYLAHAVPDPQLRAKLVPDYQMGCKRILFANTWYPTLTRPHVDVVTDRIERLEHDGVRTADGVLHPADVVVWGTGFAATSFLDGIRVVGRDGLDLHEQWSDGARAHLGISVPGFPNLFCVYGPNTNLGGSSIIAMMESQAGWIREAVAAIRGGRARTLEVRPDVAERYDVEMQERLGDSVWAGCDSWYRDGTRITTNWPGLVTEYRRRTRHVDWAELEVDAG